jgi:hypothetical protein
VAGRRGGQGPAAGAPADRKGRRSGVEGNRGGTSTRRRSISGRPDRAGGATAPRTSRRCGRTRVEEYCQQRMEGTVARDGRPGHWRFLWRPGSAARGDGAVAGTFPDAVLVFLRTGASGPRLLAQIVEWSTPSTVGCAQWGMRTGMPRSGRAGADRAACSAHEVCLAWRAFAAAAGSDEHAERKLLQVSTLDCSPT